MSRGRGTGSGFCCPAAVCAVAILYAAASAFATAPDVKRIIPTGGTRGAELEIRILGDRLGDAADVLFTREGIEVLEVRPVEKKTNEARARIRIAPDCPLGPRAMYLRTTTGLSGITLFTVGALAETDEKEPNSLQKDANAIAPGTTVNGVITNEDLDFFSFEAAAGQTLVFEVEALRLGASQMDPAITLHAPDGRELAAADDTPLMGQDCVLIHKFAEAGTYALQVREAAYLGGGDFAYRLHFGEFPRPLAAFPPGGRPGEEVTVRWIGDDRLTTQTLRLPESAGVAQMFPLSDKGIAPSAVPMMVSDLEAATETEPNNNTGQATTMTVPGAAHGVIEKENDSDFFKFAAKKGENYEVRLWGRRIRSPLDSVVVVRPEKGRALGSNDDQGGVDSTFDIAIPEDGEYTVQVRDHLDRGGAEYVYRLEIEPKRPGVGVVAQIPGRQELRSFTVPLGNRNAMIASVRRDNTGGDMILEGVNLPPGVRAIVEPVPNGVSVVPVLFEADETSTASATLSNLAVRSADESAKLSGEIGQEVVLVTVLNQEPVLTHMQREMPLAVTERVPFRIEVVETKTPLVRGGVKDLKVKVLRDEGYKDPVTLRVLWRPNGVGARTEKVNGDTAEINLRLDANDKAQLGTFKLAVIGSGKAGDADAEVSSQLFDFTVEEPWINLGWEKIRTEQGTKVEMAAKVEVTRPFEGEAEVKLAGLPNKVTAGDLKLGKDTADLKFEVDVPADAPVGRHGSVFALATVMHGGEPVIHYLRGGELRVDKPLPPPPAPKAEEGAPPPPKPTGPVRGERKVSTGIAPFTRGGE